MLLLALALTACSDDDGSPDAGDTGDAGTDAIDTTDATADGSGADADLDVDPEVFGTVRGNIFYNGDELPLGTLSAALVDANPPTIAFQELTFATLPPRAYEFTDVPAGEYHLLAFYDIGPVDSWDAPGESDLIAVTESSFGITEDGQVVENINVELR